MSGYCYQQKLYGLMAMSWRFWSISARMGKWFSAL